jgi:hut operon positive regulator
MDNENNDVVQDAVRGPRGIGRRAMLLAMTPTREEENAMKQAIDSQGFRCAATEVGGYSNDESFQSKTIRAAIGAALNSHIIEKEARAIHALIHATEEAKKGVIVNTSSGTSLSLKVAIVGDGKWIAVAFYGESSIHSFTCHERCGLGIMHLPG